MRLLIDAGNTRIKWALSTDEGWLGEGALAHSECGALEDALRSCGAIHSVLGANVAGAGIAAQLEAVLARHGLVPRWLTPAATACGVTNRYDAPSQLGADRWAALIGAHALHPGPAIVVSAGTATTIDLLTADGTFEGGLILPGEQLMRQSLALETAQLPLAEGDAALNPRNTRDAIVTGCLFAQAGAIERMFRRIAHHPDALCVLAGGTAARLEPLLELPCRRIDNLVLRGLERVARDDDDGILG